MLKRFDAWIDIRVGKFSEWCIKQGKAGAIIFDGLFWGFMGICILIVAWTLYLGMLYLNVDIAVARGIAPALAFLFFAGIILYGHVHPVKTRPKPCSVCGLPADMCCWKGDCAPFTRYCTVHYVQRHLPPDMQEDFFRYMASAQGSGPRLLDTFLVFVDKRGQYYRYDQDDLRRINLTEDEAKAWYEQWQHDAEPNQPDK